MDRKNLPGQVYVVGAEEVRLVKIGWTTRPLHTRLGAMQNWSPLRLQVLWTAPGNGFTEEWLHERFVDLRHHNEWFDFGDRDPVRAVENAYEDRLRELARIERKRPSRAAS